MTRVRRRLLVVSSSLGEGGAQRVTSTLLMHLSRDALDIHLCLFKRIIDYALPDEIPVNALLERNASLGARPWLIPGALLRLRETIARTRPDVVLSVIDQVNLVAAAALGGQRFRPRWIARSGANPDCQSRAQRVLAGWAYRRADTVIANTSALAGRLARTYPGSAERVVHLANPTDFSRLDELATRPPLRRRDPSRPLVVFVGRLVKEKRPDVLIEAAAILRRRRPFQLWVCGGGSLTSATHAQIRALGLDADVELLGFCDNPYALLAQADAFVMTSKFEGLPNGLIEAQGLGVPAVSTDCDFGPGEIIADGETGLLVPVNDAAAIADSLDALLGDEKRRVRMGQAAARRARSLYAVESLIGRWQQLLESDPAVLDVNPLSR